MLFPRDRLVAFIPAALLCCGATFAWAGVAQKAPRAERAQRLQGLLQKARTERSTAPVDEFLTTLKAEQDPLLYKFNLEAALRQRMPMTRAQQREVISLVRAPGRGLLPSRPPVPKTGDIEVRYYLGREFFDAGMQELSDRGFQFGSGPSGETEARRGRIHLRVDTSDDRVLKDLQDPKVHVIIYSGHSELGGLVERALAQPGLEEHGAKLVALMQCKGIQTLPLLSSRMPKAHILTTNDYSYSQTDQKFIHVLLDGLEHGQTYKQIRHAVTEQRANYLFPDRMAIVQHMDFDKNGKLDGRQLAEPDGAFQSLSAHDRAAAQRMLSAAHYVQNMNAYYAEEVSGAVFTRAQTSMAVVPMGIEKGDGQSVTHIREREVDGRRVVEVALDEKYARAPRDLVAAATVYELQLHLQSSLLGKTDARARARAVGLAGEYLNRMLSPARGARALAQLAELKQLPKLQPYQMPRGVHALDEASMARLEQALAAPVAAR